MFNANSSGILVISLREQILYELKTPTLPLETKCTSLKQDHIYNSTGKNRKPSIKYHNKHCMSTNEVGD